MFRTVTCFTVCEDLSLKRFRKLKVRIYVVVQFVLGLIFIFPCSFLCLYMIMNIKQKNIRIEPRIKLNYNIHTQLFATNVPHEKF